MNDFDLNLWPDNEMPICVGAGFIALDIIEGRHGDFATVGGSCGNVMSILSWLGWDVKPIGRLRNDVAGEYIKQELDAAGVDTTWISIGEKGESPIVIQKFVENADGQRRHRYSLTCPDCKGWLPRFRPTTIAHATEAMASLDAPAIYYFDRTSPATLKLAQWAKDTGAIIVFEPSSIGDEGRFQKAVDLCHVLKFSDERFSNLPDLLEAESPKIIIQTAGADGLDVRWKGSWTRLPAFKAPVVEDAAGSGDWCTAALIHGLGNARASGLSNLRKGNLMRILRLGQAMAAVNCAFEGARGAMMVLSKSDMMTAMRQLTNEDVEGFEAIRREVRAQEPPRVICFSCSGEKLKAIERLSA